MTKDKERPGNKVFPTLICVRTTEKASWRKLNLISIKQEWYAVWEWHYRRREQYVYKNDFECGGQRKGQLAIFIYLFIYHYYYFFLSKGQRKGWRLKRKGWRLIWWFWILTQVVFSLFCDPPAVTCGLYIVLDPKTSQVQMFLNIVFLT